MYHGCCTKKSCDYRYVIEPRIKTLACTLASKAIKYEKLPAVGRTHGQHASIISFGLKFANWAMGTKHIER